MMESFTVEEKREISKSIKNITIDKVNKDWLTLKNIDTHKLNNKCNSGLSVVDYFTFEERLHTKGKYNVNFFEFTQNIEEFKKKRFIQTMFNFYHKVKNIKGKKNEYVVQKEIYNICITAINAFKPTIAMHVFSIYSPKSVLDFCCGWGGRLIGACALNVKSFIGIEINKNLEKPYVEMQEYLETCSSTEIQILIEDALNTDYSKLIYDMVLTSPPYFFFRKIQKQQQIQKQNRYERQLLHTIVSKDVSSFTSKWGLLFKRK
jgi:hypothetical protein